MSLTISQSSTTHFFIRNWFTKNCNIVIRSTYDILFLFLMFTLSFSVRKHAFVSYSSYSCVDQSATTLDALNVTAMDESHVYSTLWCTHCVYDNLKLSPRLGLRFTSRKGFLLLLLLMAGDIETCPGPTSSLFADVIKIIRSRGLKNFHQNLHCLPNIEQLRLR